MSELREIHDSITTPPIEVQTGFITHRPVEVDQKVEVESGDRISIKSPVEDDELEIETHRSEETCHQQIKTSNSDLYPTDSQPTTNYNLVGQKRKYCKCHLIKTAIFVMVEETLHS